MASTPPTALTCPSCGAALPAGYGQIECAYCGTVVRVDAPASQPSQATNDTTWSSSSVTVIRLRPQPATAPKPTGRSPLRGFLLLLATIVLGVGIAFVAIPDARRLMLRVVQPKLYASDQLLVLTPDRPRPQILARVNGAEANASRLALLDLEHGDRIWVGTALTKDAVSGQLAANNDMVVFSDGQLLLGMRRNDGARRWSALLNDRPCDGCLVIIGNVAVVLTADPIIQAYDLTTGTHLWDYRDLGRFASSKLRVVGTNLLVYARDNDGHGEVKLLDPVQGTLVRSFVPACRNPGANENPDYSDADSPQWLSPDGQTLVVATNTNQPCFHAYDTATGTQRWQTILDQSPGDFAIEKEFVQSGQELIASGRNQIYAIELSHGSTRTVITDPEFGFHVLTSHDGVLLTLAIKQRGTSRIERWGIDLAQGTQLWRTALGGDGRMFEPPYQASGTLDKDEQAWGWAETPTGLMIVTLQAKPQRYTIETIDMRTGRATNTKIVARPDVRTVWAPHLAARQGSTLYLVGGAQLVVLDLEAGAVLYEGP